MPRSVALVVLYASPIILTVMLCIVAFGIHAVGRGFGSSRSPAPIIIVAAVLWLLHAGYIAGPWLYQHHRHAMALWLMVPFALAGVLAAVFIAKQIIPENSGAMDGKFVVYCSLWTLAVVGGYLAPIVVMIMPAAQSADVVETPAMSKVKT